MFKKEEWKAPFLKRDLKNVILFGILFAILGGILGGALDYLFYYIDFSIKIGLVIVSLMVGYMVYRAYNSYHILFPVLTIPFMILGLFVAHFTSSLINSGFSQFFNILGSGDFYLNFLVSPFSLLILGIKGGSAGNIIFGIINIVIYILAFYACYSIVSSKKKK